MGNMKKIYIVSLGCPKNLTDTEKIMASSFKDYQSVSQPQDADIIFINTCSFIVPAKEESIETILEFIELKKNYPEKRIVVSGCLLEQHEEVLKAEFPEVEFLSNKNIFFANDRIISTYPYAYLKIAEGCSRACSFCSIPLFKGSHRSRPIEDILKEAKALEGKLKELILVSQDTSSYGIDLYQKNRFSELLDRLSDLEFPWIRVMYYHPQNLTKEILKIMAEKKNICKYIDIPLQHLSDSILKSMNRWGKYSDYKKIVNSIREHMPESAIRTSFILGFPGETEEDFEILLNRMEELQFDRAVFFSYSEEEKTKAALLENKVSEEDKEIRYSKAVFIQEEISESKLKNRLGQNLKVLVESYDEKKKKYFGRSEFDAPEVDGIVLIDSQKDKLPLHNFVNLQITGSDIHNIWGKTIKK